MPLRHRLEPDSWQSVFRRLEELVLGNSGEDDFQETFKLVVAKLFQEAHEADTPLLAGGPADTVERVNALLERADHRWPGVLPDGASVRLSPDHLWVCAEAIDPLTLHGAGLEVMDALFEHLVGRASKGSKGQYFTPRHVVEAVVRMTAPTRGETVADPACGSGGFLLHAMAAATGGRSGTGSAGYSRDHLWGFDIDGRALQVARAMMAVAADGGANLHRLNSLLPDDQSRPTPPSGAADTVEAVMRRTRPGWTGFDVIVTNPPFAGEVREPALLEAYELARGPGRRTERDALFVERCVRLLRPGGRLAIVLPANKTGGERFGHVREWLIRHARVVAVLGLGRDTFQPHTSQRADVVFAVRRPRPVTVDDARAERVLFLTSERSGKDSAGAAVFVPGADPTGPPTWADVEHDLDDAVSAFHAFVAHERIDWGAR